MTDLLAERPSDDNRAPYRPVPSDRVRALVQLARLRATLEAARLVRVPGVTRASNTNSPMHVHRLKETR